MTLGYRGLDERGIVVGTCGIGASVFLPGEFHKQRQRVDNCVPVSVHWEQRCLDKVAGTQHRKRMRNGLKC